MSRLTVVLLVAVGAAGCPTQQRCAFDPFASNPTRVWGITHQPLSITVAPTITVCGDEPLRANVSLIDPNNAPFNAFATSTVVNEANGRTRQTLLFTPDRPGTWQLIVYFEPLRGRVQVPIDVADERLDTPRSSVTVSADPSSCAPQPFMTLHGLVLCQFDGGIHTRRADGGEAFFEGEQLLVLGNSVWSSESDRLMLRTDTGSELQVVSTVGTDGLPLPDRGYTDERSAIRMFVGHAAAGTVMRYVVTDAGLIGAVLPASVSDVVLGGDGPLYRLTYEPPSGVSQVCHLTEGADAGCSSLGGTPRTLDTSGLWVDVLSSGLPTPIDLLPMPFIDVSPTTFLIAEGWSALPQMLPTTPLNRSADAILMNWGMRALVDREALVLTRPESTVPLVVRRVEARSPSHTTALAGSWAPAGIGWCSARGARR